MESIRNIIQEIPSMMYFDSHYVVNQMIEKFPGDYDALCKGINVTGRLLKLRTHQKIGHLIKAVDGEMVHRQEGRSSWSVNVNGNSGKCALWQRIPT